MPETLPTVDPEEEIAELFADLHSQSGGLEERQTARRLQQVGANTIRRESGTRAWRGLLGQFTHPLALLLWVAATLALVTGVLPLAGAIVVVIVLNAAFAFGQERPSGCPSWPCWPSSRQSSGAATSCAAPGFDATPPSPKEPDEPSGANACR